MPTLLISRVFLLLSIALMGAAVASTPAPAESAPDLPAIYNEGNVAFAAGDFQTAAERFEFVLKQVPPEAQKQFEPLYFTLGATYFNLKEYTKAIHVFQTYLEKFPKSTRAADVQFALAQANLASGQFAAAVTQFLALESVPRLRDQSLLFAAQALKDSGKTADSIGVLERLIGAGIRSRQGADGALLLASLRAEKEPGKARESLLLVEKNTAFLDNIARLNATLIQVADSLLEGGHPAEALELYRMVRSQEEVLRFHQERTRALDARLAANLATMRENPATAPDYLAANEELRLQIKQNKTLLAELEEAPDPLAGLLLRQAQAFYGLERKREATILYQELLDRRPDSAEREPALFRLAATQAELGKTSETRSACDQYLKLFPSGENLDAVEYLKGATALEAGEYSDAETFFGIALDRNAGSDFRDRLLMQLANARFAQGKFTEARADYEKYLAEFPRGQEAGEAVYRGILTYVFDGQFETAMEKLRGYLAQYPDGTYAADAKYRLAVCKYAASLYEEVIADCLAWEKEYPKDAMRGETLSLLGDAYAALDQSENAIAAYIRSLEAAETDEVIGYVLLEAAKLLQKSAQWDRLSSTFEEFVRDHPDNPHVVTAAFWLAKARSRAGKEAEAKTFIAETISKPINDRESQAVESLLTQLAQLCAKKNRSVSDEQPADPLWELRGLLNSPAATNPIAKARGLFAESELLKMRKDPVGQEKTLMDISSRFKPADLSAPLLAACGDLMLARGDFDKATPFYTELMESFPKNDYVDHAYCGFGDMAFAKGNFEEALGFYNRGLDDIAPAQKLKDLTVGKGRAQLALGHLDDADKTFAQVAAVREWRGDATAFSVYSLGEIEMKRGDWAKAIAYFQRVYVAYRRYLPWVAKSYLRSAECFQKLGKLQEAKNTYGEMLMNEKLRDFPERKEAEQKLQELGAS